MRETGQRFRSLPSDECDKKSHTLATTACFIAIQSGHKLNLCCQIPGTRIDGKFNLPGYANYIE
jgi:hypothetical protein